MTGPLLRTGNLKSFHPLGAVGNPVYLAAPQLRVAIARRLDARIADSFAIPQRNEDGDTIDWYAPNAGPVVPWSAASPEERAQAREQLLEVRTRIHELAAQMQQETGAERQVFGRLLEQVSTFPDDEHIYLVNGHPVITFWGFHYNEGVVGDPLLDLELAKDEPEPPAKKRGLPWWLWLLLLLLLIGLGLFLLRACQPPPEIPGEPMTPASNQATDPIPPENGNAPAEEPVTELTAADPAWQQQAADETDQAYAERMRTRVRRDYDRQASYRGTDGTRVDNDASRVDSVDETMTREQGETLEGELEPGEIVIGEDGEIEAIGADPEELVGELPDDPALPDTLPMDEPPGDEPPIDDQVNQPIDPAAQNPEESPADELPQEQPPEEAPSEEPPPPEEPQGEPVDPNAQGPESEEPSPPEPEPQPPEPDQPPDQPPPPEADQPPAEDPAQPPAGEEPPSSPPDQAQLPEPDARAEPPAPGEPPAPPSQPTATAAPEGNSASQGPGPNAAQNTGQNMGRRHRYSSGNWRPSISLQDPRTGLPLKIEYDMKDGRGQVKLRRHDGSVCTGNAGSAVQNGKSIINATSNIRCPDGTNFGRPTLECPPGSQRGQGGKGCVLRYSPSGPGVPVGAMKPAP